MIKEFLASNIGRIVLMIVVLLVAGAIILSIQNEGTANAVEQIASEIQKQFPEAPYTAAALPASLTERFSNLRAVPKSWNNRGACGDGSRQTPSGGCWSLIVDNTGLLNFIVPGLTRQECLAISKTIRPDILVRLAFVSIATDGANSQSNALAMQPINPQLRGAAIDDHAASNCRDSSDNQWSLIFR